MPLDFIVRLRTFDDETLLLLGAISRMAVDPGPGTAAAERAVRAELGRRRPGAPDGQSWAAVPIGSTDR